MMQYPMVIYSIDGLDKLVTKLVTDEESEACWLAKGWKHSPAEFGFETCPGKEPDPVLLAIREKRLATVAPVLIAAEVEKEPTRSTLLQAAYELNIKVDGRWSDARLTEEIKAAQDGNSA